MSKQPVESWKLVCDWPGCKAEAGEREEYDQQEMARVDGDAAARLFAFMDAEKATLHFRTEPERRIPTLAELEARRNA